MKRTLSIIAVSIIVLSTFSTMIPLSRAYTDDWSEPQQLTSDPAQDYCASIMQDSNSKIWLVWARSMPNMPGDLWFKTSLDGGISWSTPVILVPDTLQEGGTSLLQDSTGRIWVAWASGQYSPHIDWDIYYIMSDDGGLSWSPRQQLTDDPTDDSYPCLVEVAGEVWIVFMKQPFSNMIWYYKFTVDNLEKTGPFQVSTSSSARVIAPSAMVDSTGKVWIVWTQDKDVYYKTSTDNGASWSPDQQLTSHPNTETLPVIIKDICGRIFVFYNVYDGGTPDDVWYKTSEDSGNTWSASQKLTEDTHVNTSPCVASINSEIWVVWSSDRSRNVDLWLSKTSPPISWEYIFEDSCRGTVLKISTDDEIFQFIAPDKTFSIKHDPNMTVSDHFIAINFGDTEIKLYAMAIITRRWGFCIATVIDIETGTRYWLIDMNWHWEFSTI